MGYLLRDRVAPVNLELEAYRTGSRDLLVELICMDPWTCSVRQAREFVDAILRMEYNAEMKPIIAKILLWDFCHCFGGMYVTSR